MSVLLPSLNEKQKRLLVGAEAIVFGYGGIKFLSGITGMSTNTITKGIREIESGDEDVSRIRSKGLEGKKVPDNDMKELRLVKNKFNGEWNYTIRKRKF